jgi:queuine tRNA-ribosyltransferase
MFEFKITAKDKHSAARTGVFQTPHGSFQTPVFMPVGTYGAVKTVTPEELRACGAEIILGNTYHLHLRPGEKLVKKFGGLQKFNHWDGPILTDSGGFQVFSLASHRKIYEDRVEFASPLDGSKHVFTPRKVLEIQQDLGSDIMMQLDECAPGDASRAVAEVALTRTMRWAEETVKHWKNRDKQALFPIVQGVTYPDLRKASAQFCAALPTPGIAIGGLAVGESKADFLKTLEIVTPYLPEKKPHYLMGVGEPMDILNAVARGIDMFDCVIPTRLARHGSFFIAGGKRAAISNAKFKTDKKPLLKNCKCEACQNYSRGYIHHLFRINEMLGQRLLTLHNLTFLLDFMQEIRSAIEAGTFSQMLRKFQVKV